MEAEVVATVLIFVLAVLVLIGVAYYRLWVWRYERRK